MPTLTFEFTLPAGTTYPFVLVAGALDANRDGQYDTATESIAFVRINTNTWRGQIANVPPPLPGMTYVIQYTIGPNVSWALKVYDDAGALHGGAHGVSVFASELTGGILS